MSALATWQAEVGARLLTGDRLVVPDGDTPAQRAGWPVTLKLYRQERLHRIRSQAALTLSLLGDQADLVLDTYLAITPGCPDTDATAFLNFAAAARPADPYLAEITFLELALIRARRPASADTVPSPGYLSRSRRASLRVVPFPAAALMLWLGGLGDPPSEIRGGVPVLVAPAVTGWVRPATEYENAIWHWLAMDRPEHLADAVHAKPIDSLRQAGAIR